MNPHFEESVHRERLLVALERLLEIEATELRAALNQASQITAEVLGADKVDVFLYEADSDTLVAVGSSDTPMSREERWAGLDRNPIAHGGPLVGVFLAGEPYLNGHADQDPNQPRGFTERLGIQSELDCALEVDGERRGVIGVTSVQSERFREADLPFLQAASRWIGMVMHRTELFERLRKDAYEQGRRSAAEELISLLTPRQREVAALIAAGRSNREIAERLVLSERTVANHVQAILDRLGADRRSQVAAWVSEAGGREFSAN